LGSEPIGSKRPFVGALRLASAAVHQPHTSRRPMKISRGCYTFAFALLATTSSALALDVINQDGKAYDLEVKNTSGSVSKFSLKANASISGICNDTKCTVTVKGSNSLEAGKDEKLIIKDGKIKKWL